MTSLGSRIINLKQNNLNAIRLFLALMVVFSHSFPVALGSGGERFEPVSVWTLCQASSGALAVSSFFFISGLLITASWLHSRSAIDFLMRRVLRIYPGFIVATGFSAALIWMFCPQFRTTILHPVVWFCLLLKDWLMLTNNSITWHGVFASNPFPLSANASLWTIPEEFRCYLMVLLAGVIGLFKRRYFIFPPIVLGYILSVVYEGRSASQCPCLACFLTGMAAWLWKDKIPFLGVFAGGCLVGLLAASQIPPWFTVLFPLLGGYCILWLAYGPILGWFRWTDKVDLSYGTYLYAFPIQQMLAMNTILRHPLVIFTLAAPLTLFCAWLSWTFVEKRFLAMKGASINSLIINRVPA